MVCSEFELKCAGLSNDGWAEVFEMGPRSQLRSSEEAEGREGGWEEAEGREGGREEAVVVGRAEACGLKGTSVHS